MKIQELIEERNELSKQNAELLMQIQAFEASSEYQEYLKRIQEYTAGIVKNQQLSRKTDETVKALLESNQGRFYYFIGYAKTEEDRLSTDNLTFVADIQREEADAIILRDLITGKSKEIRKERNTNQENWDKPENAYIFIDEEFKEKNYEITKKLVSHYLLEQILSKEELSTISPLPIITDSTFALKIIFPKKPIQKTKH